MTKPKKGLVEAALQLKTGDFGKGLLKTAKSGAMGLKGPFGAVHIQYQIDPEQDPLILELEYCLENSGQAGYHNQTIELELKEATYGTTWLFRCQCGRRANILYLPKDRNQFLCRHCHNLTYEICNLNKTTMGGLFAYTNRLQRLMAKREDIDRMFYGNKFTRKAQALYKWQEKWGFGVPEEVKQLAELQIKLNSQ